jgi:hypothetical protein
MPLTSICYSIFFGFIFGGAFILLAAIIKEIKVEIGIKYVMHPDHSDQPH